MALQRLYTGWVETHVGCIERTARRILSLYIQTFHQLWRFPDLCISGPHTGLDDLIRKTLGYLLPSWQNGEARFPLICAIDCGEHSLDRMMRDLVASVSLWEVSRHRYTFFIKVQPLEVFRFRADSSTIPVSKKSA